MNGPVPTVCRRSAGSSLNSAGKITIGTLNEDMLSMNVGCGCFMWITKVAGSGVSQPAVLARLDRSMPNLL